MAREVTLAQLKTRLDTICDIENDTHVTPAQKLDAINAGYAKFWDFLIANGPPDYKVKSVTFSSVAGTTSYALSSVVSAGDFYKIKQLEVDQGGNQYRPLQQLDEWYIQSYRPPQSAVSLRLWYIPACPVLANDADKVDGVNGWEELILCYAAMDIKTRKDEEIPRWLTQKAKELEDRIRQCARRDAQPERIIRRAKWRDPYNLYRHDVDAYRLRGDNIELYYHEGYHLV